MSTCPTMYTVKHTDSSLESISFQAKSVTPNPTNVSTYLEHGTPLSGVCTLLVQKPVPPCLRPCSPLVGTMSWGMRHMQS